MFVAMQRDMLETKAEFKGAQKERSNCQRQKTSIETKIAVSNVIKSSIAQLVYTHTSLYFRLCSRGKRMRPSYSQLYLPGRPAGRQRELLSTLRSSPYLAMQY